MSGLKGILLGDAMIPSPGFEGAWDKHLAPYGDKVFVGDWETNWDALQRRRLVVEQQGPEVEPCDPLILEHGKDANVLCGLFIACSSKVMDAMPNLRMIGVSRAGLENVNAEEATKRGILVFNVMGRNAQAVSDFAVGLMLAEARNSARAFHAIKTGQWRKKFSNSEFIPELEGKTFGLVGFGYIGSLVAKKLQGWEPRILVHDPYADPERIKAAGCIPASLEEVFSESDFVSLHARLTKENKGMIDARLIGMMKPTAILVNTGRSGLVDQDALVAALREKRILGAALDVFDEEPLPSDSPYLELDNVTLTTHIAGTTADALGKSPYLLMNEMAKFLRGEDSGFIVNRAVLENPEFKAWLEGVRK
jgi:D-3-phosphoglycerate dehydrogenase